MKINQIYVVNLCHKVYISKMFLHKQREFDFAEEEKPLINICIAKFLLCDLDLDCSVNKR